MPFCYTPFHLSALSSLCTHLWHLSINLDTPRTNYRWWHVCFPAGNLPYSLQFLYMWHRTPTNKLVTFDNIHVSEATYQVSVEAQCLPLGRETMFKTQDCVNGAICDAVPRVNRALPHCQFVTWFHGTHVIVLLFTHTPFRAPILRKAHSVTLRADRLHRISLKSDNKRSKSAYAADFIYVPNYITASIRRFWRTHDHSKFPCANPVPNFIESRRLWRIRENLRLQPESLSLLYCDKTHKCSVALNGDRLYRI